MSALFSYLLPFLCLLPEARIPAGSHLQIRLQNPVASWSSRVGTPISAVLIAPVIVDGQVVLPAGSQLTGHVGSVTRVGLGIRHERASITLDFSNLTIANRWTVPLDARVISVDNARERVLSEGVIQGVRATSSISYRVSGYLKLMLMWSLHAELAEWAVKSLVVQLPEPEIYFPTGTELTLNVAKALTVPGAARESGDAESLAGTDLAELQVLIAAMPTRTSDPASSRPSDLTNVLLAGSGSEITAAFRRAGWTLAQPLSIRTRIRYIRAAAEVHGYAAPMSSLLLNGVEADMCWQKGLNDVSKRHHIRLWKQPGLWKGKQLWLAAATHDVDFAYLRPGRTFSHRIDPAIDDEREKVAYDLAFTSCATPIRWIERSQLSGTARSGTGTAIFTDGRIAVIRINQCSTRPSFADESEPSQQFPRGGPWQRFLRREILVARNDFLRSNPYWRVGEAARWMLARVHERNQTIRAALIVDTSAASNLSARRKALRSALSSLQ